MSLFWDNFNSNGKAKLKVIAELRESLADVCEGFALRSGLPRWQRRQTLLTELKKLADHYRRSETWQESR